MAQIHPLADGVRLRLERHETDLMKRLTAEMKDLLSDEPEAEERVLRRLYPDAYEDEDSAAAYRDLIGGDLRQSKRRALAAVSEVVNHAKAVDVELSDADMEAWLTALNDMRLAIGSRLEVTEEDMAAEIDPDDEEAFPLAILHWLSYIQESMLTRLVPMEDLE